MFADIDHTVPYPHGATHPANIKCYCRKHHLVKTFWEGWADAQAADGTVRVTTPTGHTYTAAPFSALLFPVLEHHHPAATRIRDPPPPRSPGRG